MPINIAMDGPAGAGKSTVAKAAAKALGFIYVDTGALYRSVAYYAVSKGADCKSAGEVVPLLAEITPELKFIDGAQRVFLNGEDVSGAIRSPEMSMYENNVIMDGRDIGTVVLPNADLKIFFTASPEERARRRHNELTEKGECVTFASVLAEVNERDYNDSHRDIAPLKQADDAVLCDNTDMNFEQSVEAVISMIKETISRKGQ